MTKRKVLFAGVAAVALVAAGAASAVGLFPGFPNVGAPATTTTPQAGGGSVIQTPAGAPAITGNETIPVDTNLPQGQLPVSELLSTSALRQFSQPGAVPRNFADNPAMEIAQRGTGQINCGGTGGTGSGASLGSGYVADRWACIVNVGSQAGKVQVSTSNPPAGFKQYSQIIRNSGSLAQPVCLLQELPTSDVLKLAGQTVILSAFEQALAGLLADNNNQSNLVIIAGTGTDEGMGTMTASPAITPAFTGVSTVQNQVQGITTTWTRYANNPVLIPSTATELAYGVCFTPTTTTTGGSTDGLNATGFQFEISGAAPMILSSVVSNPAAGIFGGNLVPTGAGIPSPFEFRPKSFDLKKALEYYFVYTEATAPNTPPFPGQCAATNTPTFSVPFQQPMRAAPSVPTSGNSQVVTVGGLKVSIAGAASAALTGINSPASSNTTTFGTIAGTNTCTAGATTTVVTSNTTGILPFSADF